MSENTLLLVCSECDVAWKCRGLQKVQRVKRNSRMVLGKGGLGGGGGLILSMLVSSPPPGVGIYMGLCHIARFARHITYNFTICNSLYKY